MDLYMLGIIAGVVAVLSFVLYLWDRSSKQQPIEWLDAGKIALSAGGVASGVAYAVGSEDAVENVVAAAQDMFVGKPEF
jgi:hypothetical protein